MIHQLQHQPQQSHIHARNNKMSNNYIGILGHNKSSQCKTRNVENVNDKCFNYYSNGVCSLSQPRNSNSNRSSLYNKHILMSGINCNNGVDIVHNHFTNNNNNSNSNSSNPEYVQILKNKINELQQENEMLKDKYSYVSEMLSSERNNVMPPSCYNSNTNCNNNNNNTYEREYQSLNELKQENLQFKQQIEILSQRIATLEAEKQQHEHDTYNNNNNNYNTIDATNNINNSTTLNTINTSRKPKHNTYNNHSTTTTTSKYNRNSISYGNTSTSAGTRKGIMNLKKKSSNINKIKHSTCSTTTTTTKHSPRSVVIKKAKMKIKIPKSANNNNECMKECDVVKDMNSVYNVNTQIQKTEMNVLKLSNEFNKLINQRYCDNEIVKDVITKVSNDLISKTEELLTLYKQQHSMITMHLA